jgi:hypothetical protein
MLLRENFSAKMSLQSDVWMTNSFLVSEDGCGGDVHLVDGIEEVCETVVRGSGH